MHLPHVNYFAVLTSGVVIFILGGLWYSLLFAKPWMALMGVTEEKMKAFKESPAAKMMPLMYFAALICALLIAWVLAVIINHFGEVDAMRGAEVGAVCWLGFAGATSFASEIFSMRPLKLWIINSGYNLASFVIAGVILGAWR